MKNSKEKLLMKIPYTFNKILWHGLKGNIPYPAPRRAAFVTPTEKD